MAGAFDNQAGSLDSRGFLTVKSAWLDNQGGTLSSAGALAVTSQGALNNRGGRAGERRRN
ncbi:hypothetical protein P4233_31900 [Pseudomonas aeruginosa]|nr:hypothetical protein [Pseudomonas aeruginosa]